VVTVKSLIILTAFVTENVTTVPSVRNDVVTLHKMLINV